MLIPKHSAILLNATLASMVIILICMMISIFNYPRELRIGVIPYINQTERMLNSSIDEVYKRTLIIDGIDRRLNKLESKIIVNKYKIHDH